MKEHKKPKKGDTEKSGWREFLTEKHEILDGFNRSKAQVANRPIKVNQGKFAEAEFRKWLKQFLPKKYDVTSGYIISQQYSLSIKPLLLHYDVIIYDQLNAPVLWAEDNADLSEQGKIKAIPAEYVHGVLEIKSSLNKTSISQAFSKLNELNPLLEKIDDEGEFYRKYIPIKFYMGIVFFELLEKNQKQTEIFSKLIPTNFQRGFSGGVILTAEGLNRNSTGLFKYIKTNEPMSGSVDKDRLAVTEGAGRWSKSVMLSSNEYIACLLDWSESNFARFAFELIAVMDGTYRQGFIPSWHGMSFTVPVNEEQQKRNAT
jgi:hypothetical protein